MTLKYRDMSMQDAGKREQRTIPKSRHPRPDPVRETREPREEHDADMQFPLFAGLNPALRGSRAEGIPEETDAGEPGVPDEVRVRIVDSFLNKLGKKIHTFCSQDQWKSIPEPMPEAMIDELCDEICQSFSKEIEALILPLLETSIKPALSRIPCRLLAEKDPDHEGENDVPDIKELLALDAYLQEYEQINPEGKSSEILSGYHRGATGQPDFVYQNEQIQTLKSYDPLRLPRNGSEKKWLEGAYNHHAGGKNTGAVCILDVSDATEAQLDNWIRIFRDKSVRIMSSFETQGDISQIEAELIHLCNTYVVSYDQNVKDSKVKILKAVFDETRVFLQNHPELTQLEQWRETEMRGIFSGAPSSEGMFAGLFDIPQPKESDL